MKNEKDGQEAQADPLADLRRLLDEPKDSRTIHYDEDTIPHGACSDPIHCDCMCPHCWARKVAIIERGIAPVMGRK